MTKVHITILPLPRLANDHSDHICSPRMDLHLLVLSCWTCGVDPDLLRDGQRGHAVAHNVPGLDVCPTWGVVLSR